MPRRMRDLRGRLAAAGLALALLAGCAAGQQPASTASPSPAAPNAQTPEAAAAAAFGEMEQATPGLRAMGEDGMYLLEQYFSGAMNLLYADLHVGSMQPIAMPWGAGWGYATDPDWYGLPDSQ